ncbi:MAG: MaoC family dehydratase N-terminal domain-containing protein [Actinobacteria bacterium]|nr:MaoC family dehydratase N-terminal domain-containing protein [Actinomycetota bacterium]
MALNLALVGKEYQEVVFEVEKDRVVQFAEAIGDPDPRYREGDAPLAPPTFPTVMQIMTSGQVVLDEELGLNYMLVVHGEQEYEWRKPIRVGDTLRAVPRIAEITAKGANEFLTIEAEIRDGSGEVVVVARSTLISRGTAGT